MGANADELLKIGVIISCIEKTQYDKVLLEACYIILKCNNWLKEGERYIPTLSAVSQVSCGNNNSSTEWITKRMQDE